MNLLIMIIMVCSGVLVLSLVGLVIYYAVKALGNFKISHEVLDKSRSK